MKLSQKLILSFGLLALFMPTVAACGNNSSSDASQAGSASGASSAVTSQVDYVHDGSVKLQMDYKGHSFATDGVEQVSVLTYIDGDTTHFTGTVSSLTIKSRYWGIDTPESTGKVQPYGKAASNFTKSVLKEAAENGTIVVSAPTTSYTVPSYDSTGTRFLSLVWFNPSVKNASYDQLYLLNLDIVQNGYSGYKSGGVSLPYEASFLAAEEQARALKLNLFSGEDDPLFNYGDYVDVSLYDLKKEIEASIADSTHTNSFDGQNVRVQGTVTGFTNHVLYICDHFDKEGNSLTDDEITSSTEVVYAGINIFTGMSSIPSKFYQYGAYIEVAGYASDSENFGFQISGATFPTYSYGDDGDASVVYTASQNTEHKVSSFTKSLTDLKEGDTSYLFCKVEVSDNLYCSYAYKGEDGYTLYFKQNSTDAKELFFGAYIVFTYYPYADSTDTGKKNITFSSVDDFIGKTFHLSGIYSFHKNSSTGAYKYQLLPTGNADLKLIEA